MNTRPRAVTALLLSLLTGPIVLAGCGGNDAAEQSASTTLTAADSTAGTSPTSTADSDTSADGTTGVPAFPASAEPDTAAASSGAAVTVSDIRLGRHDGFDRVVFDVGGTGTPGWDVRYVDSASSQGSGEPVDVAGGAVLQVSLTGVGYPYETGVEEFSPSRPLTGADTEVVTEVVFDATFEGTTVAFVGTTKKSPFRVYQLQNPTRVVVEVADPS